ncbi:ferredoxin [Epibacterium ulvae]|uniref:ferredoxin n=1 Tax=Epibacterium ulvae TaxID=1156985 RepID=UPI001BFBFC0F|nr:ferredoxin [Epibacterium ulvae]MBT8155752.1 ferredoxin [Epibacterium ulvae]
MPRALYSQIDATAQAMGLSVYGAFYPQQGPVNGGTLILLGTDAGFWVPFAQSREWQEGAPDPVDRWSRRVVDGLAAHFDAAAYYPFDGPPYAPFVDWALASGRAFTSPSQFLVHDQVGLMISYRGALHLAYKIDIPQPPLDCSPCLSCTTFACIKTCPAQAMVDGGPYQVAACHKHLETNEGRACLDLGCQARLACPISQGAHRDPAQSAHHMRYFHAS